MQVTICGPNLNDQSHGSFHVHAAGCADLIRGARREPEYRNGWTVEAETIEDVAEAVYSDHMAEHGEDDPYSKPDAYVSDFHFFPCCAGLAQR